MIRLHYLGHCCFFIEGKQGVKILCDPFEPALGYIFPEIQPQIVMLSQLSHAHNGVSLLDQNITFLVGPGQRKIGQIRVTGYPGLSYDPNPAWVQSNTIFTWNLENITFAHLGGLGQLPSREWVEQNKSQIDILMIPTGGIPYLNPHQAAELIESVSPKYVIPMGYQTTECDLCVAPLDEFLKKSAWEIVSKESYWDFNWKEIKAQKEIKIVTMAYNQTESLPKLYQ